MFLVEELEGHLFFLVISIHLFFFFHQLRHKLLVLIMFHVTAFLVHVLADMHLHVTNVVDVEVIQLNTLR